jgi:hypothetical protein
VGDIATVTPTPCAISNFRRATTPQLRPRRCALAPARVMLSEPLVRLMPDYPLVRPNHAVDSRRVAHAVHQVQRLAASFRVVQRAMPRRPNRHGRGRRPLRPGRVRVSAGAKRATERWCRAVDPASRGSESLTLPILPGVRVDPDGSADQRRARSAPWIEAVALLAVEHAVNRLGHTSRAGIARIGHVSPFGSR